MIEHPAWASAIDRAIAAGLAYLDAERRLDAWREATRTQREYAPPRTEGAEHIARAEQSLARAGLEVMLAEALEQGLRPKGGV